MAYREEQLNDLTGFLSAQDYLHSFESWIILQIQGVLGAGAAGNHNGEVDARSHRPYEPNRPFLPSNIVFYSAIAGL